MRLVFLFIYYGFARHLPKSTMPVLGKFAQWLRYSCAKHLFAECKGYVTKDVPDYAIVGGNPAQIIRMRK